jgi:uncharacterized membrane protein YfcA
MGSLRRLETRINGWHESSFLLHSRDEPLFAALFGVISLLYATVGQAGGTAFLALMAFAAFPSTEMRPTALALNIVVLDESVYKATTGAVLILAGAAMVLRRDGPDAPDRQAPLWGTVSVGAVVGLISGLTGVGGGVFMAPALIALGWASPKQTAALSAPFILANSAVGLVGVLFAGQFPSSHLVLYATTALVGAVVGTAIGLRWLGQTATRFILAGILLAAGVQLLVF